MGQAHNINVSVSKFSSRNDCVLSCDYYGPDAWTIKLFQTLYSLSIFSSTPYPAMFIPLQKLR